MYLFVSALENVGYHLLLHRVYYVIGLNNHLLRHSQHHINHNMEQLNKLLWHYLHFKQEDIQNIQSLLQVFVIFISEYVSHKLLNSL